jgi:hypothetical protein
MRENDTSISEQKQIAMIGNWKSLKVSAFSARARATKEKGAADGSGAAR